MALREETMKRLFEDETWQRSLSEAKVKLQMDNELYIRKHKVKTQKGTRAAFNGIFENTKFLQGK